MKQHLTILLTLISLLVPMQGGAVHVWSADNVPMVHLKDRTQYVSDPDNILSTVSLMEANKWLDSLRTTYGVENVVVVARRVKNGDTYRMAQDLGNKYGVGNKSTRRGLVVVIAVDDRRYTIAPGQGLEADFTDIETDRVAHATIIRHMKEGDVDRAVVSLSKELVSHFRAKHDPAYAQQQADEEYRENVFVVILVAVVIFFFPILLFVQWVLLKLKVIKKPWITMSDDNPRRNRRRDNDDHFPPFIITGGGGSGGFGGPIGGSFGGGSFGGGGSSGGW